MAFLEKAERQWDKVYGFPPPSTLVIAAAGQKPKAC